MIKKLKHRFILIIMALLGFVFLLIIAAINYANYSFSQSHSENILQTLLENKGQSLPENGPESEKALLVFPRNDFEFDQFLTVKLDENLNILDVIGAKGSIELTDGWLTAVQAIIAENNESGNWEGYRYRIASDTDGYILAVIDQRISDAMNQRTLAFSLLIGGISLFVFFIIALVLANSLTQPVEEAFEKQKQFISDASHELKTPIAVISVNADVLEREIGKNQYLSFIQSESVRMDYLVNDLLTLARMDSIENRDAFKVFDLSQVSEGVTLGFESSAFEAKKDLQIEIQKNISLLGDQQKIKQLLSILIDNAIKYANDNGQIKVILESKNDYRRLAVYNTGEGICETEKLKIFERFYRIDASRSKKTGGYGLGLAIAKSIVEEHHGKIWVEGQTGEWICFEIRL